MAEAVKETAKKRQTKPGTRRVTITLTEAEFQGLAKIAADQLREPNNMLSFMLKGRMEGMLADFEQ